MKFLRRFMDLGKDDVIEAWDKASTVYSADSDDEQVQKGNDIKTHPQARFTFTENLS